MDDLRALIAAATPGPWCYESIGEKGDGCNIVGVAFAPGDEDCKSPLRGRLPEWTEDGEEIEYYRDEDVCVVEHRSRGYSANTELIVAAVNALPGLLDRLAAVEKQCEELRRVVIQGVTANPGVLHHYKCLACGGRWSGRPPVAEQHIGECAAIAARKGEDK